MNTKHKDICPVNADNYITITFTLLAISGFYTSTSFHAAKTTVYGNELIVYDDELTSYGNSIYS